MQVSSATEEIIHGVTVRDPFRWLEDRTLPETAAWNDDQRRRSHSYFASIPKLGHMEERVRCYLDVEVVDQPARVGHLYFYRKRGRGEEQGKICVGEREGGEERILFDPSQFGCFASANIHRISSDGMRLAISVRDGGADRAEVWLFDLRRGRLFSRSIPRGLHRGLVFSRRGCFWCQEIDEPAGEHRIFYWRFDSMHEEAAVFRAPRSRSSRLILSASDRLLGALWLRPAGELVELARDGVERAFVPERETLIRDVVTARDRLFVRYLDKGCSTIEAWLLTGRQADSVVVPGSGTVQLLPSPGIDTDALFYSYESFALPPAIYEYCASSNRSSCWHRQELPANHPAISAREVTIPSKDGTHIPLTLVGSRDNESVRPRPVLMTSFRGFGVVLTPRFSVLTSILIGFGAVLALPHIRGGGEFGKGWHEAGRAKNRQVSIDDFIAAAEWFLSEGIADARQLGIFGGSNSGLLVAAAMTQRPDLFGAVVAIAPVLDMVRYEALDRTARWRNECGTADNPDEFLALLGYSPYHHVAEYVAYPATLFVTGDKDERCPAAHVRKMAARLQERAAQQAPILVDYSEQRGHAPAMSLSVRISALARRIAFLCRELEIRAPEGSLP